MHTSTAFALLAAAGALNSVKAYPVPRHLRREVPQEHSHEKFLTSVRASLLLDNPSSIADPVFGLLGNAAASQGLGQISDPDCLQQATADQAFTNAKAAGDVQGMTDALVFRTLERNTGAVGQKSVLCTSVQAVNPEIAALTQHQDPASPDAASTNKAITLELARQIASIGGDPQIALQSGTFSPGQIGDPTGKGNTCDDTDDPEGCIFTKGLLVEDATPEEIDAAVAGAGAGAGAGNADADADAEAGNNQNAGNNGAQVSAIDESAIDTATASATEAASADASATATASGVETIATATATSAADAAGATGDCPPPVTVTVTAGAGNAGNDDAAAPPAQATAAPAAGAGAGTNAGGAAAGGAGGVNTIEGAANLSGDVDLGSCPNIAIAFAQGINSRKETAYINANREQFPQGEAQNPNIIANAACDTLINRCGLTTESPGHALCLQAKAAVAAITVRDGKVADTWNQFFGITTNFASVQAFDNQGNPVGTPAAAGGGAAVVVPAAGNNADAGAGAGAGNAKPKPKPAAGGNANAEGDANAGGNAGAGSGAGAAEGVGATGNNVNRFTGSFGAAPIPVINSGGARAFSVNGDTFINAAAALGRACDVQKNQCANAVNSNKVEGSVADCDAQADECRAANAQ